MNYLAIDIFNNCKYSYFQMGDIEYFIFAQQKLVKIIENKIWQ